MRRPAPERRVLMIDPDLSAGSVAVEALRGSGMEATAVADAETGLRVLAASEPQVLVLDLELRGKDGRWFLRRLRDDFMGAMPRVILYTRAEALAGGVAALGADAVVLKPAHPEAILLAALGEGTAQAVASDTDRLRELVTLTLLQGDVEGAVSALAKRLAHLFRSTECILVAQVGDRHFSASSRGTARPSLS